MSLCQAAASAEAGFTDAEMVAGIPVNALLPVRFRHGVVGETRRSCHLVIVPDSITVPAELTALCGQRSCPAG